MDISLKQRLLGGALLVAVAVVFLPMMFDGSAREKPVTLDMDIPAEPDYTFAPPAGAAKEKQADLALTSPAVQPRPAQRAVLNKAPAGNPEIRLPAAGSAQAGMPAKPKHAKVERPATVKPAGKAAADEATSAEVAAVDPPAEAPPSASEPAPLSPPSESAASKSEPMSEDASPQITAWAVQVGSFSEHDNAQTLRDQLRASGFAAFEEKVHSGGEPVFRVKVGPELGRARAEALQGRLQSQEDLQGIVVSHPRDAAPVVLRGGG